MPEAHLVFVEVGAQHDASCAGLSSPPPFGQRPPGTRCLVGRGGAGYRGRLLGSLGGRLRQLAMVAAPRLRMTASTAVLGSLPWAMVHGPWDPGDGSAVELAIDSGAVEPAVAGLHEWAARSKEWPVTADCLDSLLRREGAAGGGVAAAVGRRIRWAIRHVRLAQDAGLVPKEKTYKHRRSSSAAHPGLCASKDQHIYREASTLARAVEAQLPMAGLHRYYLVGDAHQDHTPPARPANPLVGRSLGPRGCCAASRAAQPYHQVCGHHNSSALGSLRVMRSLQQ